MLQKKVEKVGVFLATGNHDIRTTLCHTPTAKSPRFYHHKTRKNRETPSKNRTFLCRLFFLLNRQLTHVFWYLTDKESTGTYAALKVVLPSPVPQT
jgi:hypothetical protein